MVRDQRVLVSTVLERGQLPIRVLGVLLLTFGDVSRKAFWLFNFCLHRCPQAQELTVKGSFPTGQGGGKVVGRVPGRR